MDMRKELHIVASMALLACLLPPVLTGCGKDSLAVNEKISIPVFLSVNDVSEGVGTKMLDKVVQIDNPQTFRGIQNFYVIPFCIAKESGSNNVREVVWSDDPAFNENIQLSSKLNQYDFSGTGPSKGYYSGGSYVNNLTNAVLVYGEAKEESSATLKQGTVAFKQRNGVIVPNEAVTKIRSNGVKASALAFDLEPMLNNTTQVSAFGAWKTAHLAMLNAIAGASSGAAVFKDPSSYENDATLSAAFRAFSGEGQVFSSADLPVRLTNLYRTCSAMPTGAKDAAKNVASAICAKMDSYTTGTSPLLSKLNSVEGAIISLTQAVNTYFGLPEGAVVFQWGEILVGTSGNSGFASPDKSEGVNLAAVQDYCYPPALWYYVNCPLMGSSVGGQEAQFKNNSTWSDIVNATSAGTAVYTRGIVLESKAALVRDPLHYAVGMLRLKLNGTKDNVTKLKDNASPKKEISIWDENEDKYFFPLTGIVIGGQRTQNFDFTAVGEDMRFIYDADVNDESGATRAWISHNQISEPIYTLTFQTQSGEDIYFALEFRNDSGESFTGVRGCTILPGSKFFLIGKMDYSNLPADQKAKQAGVFAKDHISTLTAQFEALSGAYSILPELATPDLQLGVNAKLTWDAVTPNSTELL